MSRPATLTEETIFKIACQIPSDHARDACLDQLCSEDQALKKRVLELLEADSDASALLDGPEPAPTLSVDTGDTTAIAGTAIGPYKILQKIGEGGMGVVYMAEQTAPVKRRVAVKIVKPGLDNKQVVARFEAERQALAMMDHPNVAKVLDAGSTSSGRPYFVMDLVIPITEYCDEHCLSTQERLELFMQVCRGVQHAHQKSVIHRDIKPSNVLVAQYDHQPVPKIIDFGVAKATNQELTEKTLFTQFGQIVGTLDYMSPEQARFNQLDIDMRSDIYSLGVLLYELLTGGTPIGKDRLRMSGLDEILRIIREEEPPRPSTRLSSSETLAALAARRNTDPAKLAGLLREDLDWIVIKAMAKERNDRYQTADALADDIERHINYLPIEARRPSLAGRARRFARRHRAAVAIVSLTLTVSALAVAFGTFAYLGGLKDEQQLAELEATKSEAAKVRAETAVVSRARQEVLPQVRRLMEERQVLEAFALAEEVRQELAKDPDFEAVWADLADTVSFRVKPQGTIVAYRDARAADAEWTVIGTTPLKDAVLPKCDLRLRYEKPGYASLEFQRPRSQWELRGSLHEDDAPEGMLFISGGKARPTHRQQIEVADFFIDQYEVTNQEFQAFVDDGGYERPELWSDIKFVRDGEEISWEDAMSYFVDASGMKRGPNQWSGGQFPEGTAEYPVGGVSWYEARAYAKYVDKSLPTMSHWAWAADTDQPGITTSLSNFSNLGPQPRGANIGIGRIEVYDMAGNQKEWCLNENDQGDRCMKGGAWNESDYRFHHNDFVSPWSRSPSHGFRCVRYIGRDRPERKAAAPVVKPAPWGTELERVQLEHLQWWYAYDHLSVRAEQIQLDDVEGQRSPYYRHEIIRIDAAYNDEQFDVHLFVPHDKKDDVETIIYVPGAGAWSRDRFLVRKDVDWRYAEGLVRSGRLVCQPIYKGTYERGDHQELVAQFKEAPMQAMRDFIDVSHDVSRTVDYLLTRDDVNADRLVYFGLSIGALRGPATVVTEPRFKAAVFSAGGYHNFLSKLPIIHPFHFTRHVTVPVLMLNGAGDTLFEDETSQRPFFEDLGSTDKEHMLLVGGHNPPPEAVFEKMDNWLRRVFALPE